MTRLKNSLREVDDDGDDVGDFGVNELCMCRMPCFPSLSEFYSFYLANVCDILP